MSTAEKPIVSGLLWKRATSGKGSWKKRYFCLYSDRLTYSLKQGATAKVKGEMLFNEDFSVGDGPGPKGLFGFVITDLMYAKHNLAADTKDVKDFWCLTVAKVIRKQLEKAQYFADADKIMHQKEKTQDELDKEYQQRLDAYYASTGRAPDQRRKSTADLRAAQVLSELQSAKETEKAMSEAGKAADAAKARGEVVRLEQDFAKVSKQAEGSDETTGVQLHAFEELEEDDEPDEDVAATDASAPWVPPQTSPMPEVAVSPPALPPRKNTIQPSPTPLPEVVVEPPPLPARKNTVIASSPPPITEGVSRKLTLPPDAVPALSASPPPVSVTSPSNPGSRRPTVAEPAATTTTTTPDRRPTLTGNQIPSPTHRPSMVAAGGGTTTTTPVSPTHRPSMVTAAPSPTHRPSMVTATTSPAAPAPTTDATRRPTLNNTPTTTTIPDRAKSPPPPVEPVVVAQTPPAKPPQPVPQSEKKAPEEPKVEKGIASKLGVWQKKVDEHVEKQSNNVFSGSYAGGSAVKIDKDKYGKPPEGSKTEARAIAAQEWVETEVNKLVAVIMEMGEHDPSEGGLKTVNFGDLFNRYADISDSLVGILMRAKKRQRLKYNGDLLLYAFHKHVKITVLVA